MALLDRQCSVYATLASHATTACSSAGTCTSLPTQATPRLLFHQNAVGNRVTLQLVGGGSMRVALPFAPTGPLATAALEALHVVLPADTYWALYARWLTECGWGLLARLDEAG